MGKQDVNRAGNFKDGQWDVARLRFLVDFMKAAGLTTVKLADLMGVSRQAVYYWFVKDDMRMSQIYRIFELCGYIIHFELQGEMPQSVLPVVINMSVVNPDGHRRLAFLKSALERHSITRDRVAEKIGVGKSTVYNWFKEDDCFISYVYDIAMAENMRLAIRIEPVA